jgi:hypothetical protein
MHRGRISGKFQAGGSDNGLTLGAGTGSQNISQFYGLNTISFASGAAWSLTPTKPII